MYPTVIPVSDEASSLVERRGATVTVLPASLPLSHTHFCVCFTPRLFLPSVHVFVCVCVHASSYPCKYLNTLPVIAA